MQNLTAWKKLCEVFLCSSINGLPYRQFHSSQKVFQTFNFNILLETQTENIFRSVQKNILPASLFPTRSDYITTHVSVSLQTETKIRNVFQQTTISVSNKFGLIISCFNNETLTDKLIAL
jgi:hypothetical protein